MLILHADGGCQPNPGLGTYGVVAISNGRTVWEECESIGQATNNIAEWRAAIAALSYVLESGYMAGELRMDSRMVVMQLNGRWKVKHPGLKPLAATGRELLDALRAKGVSLTIRWVPREENELADTMASIAR